MRMLRISAALVSLPVLAASAQMMMNTGGNRPSVSPDGRFIAYSAVRNGTWDIYVIHPDGTDEKRLTNVAEQNFVNLGPPTWIGDRVAVWRRVNDTTRMFLVDPLARSTASPRLSPPFDALQIRPSPDGKRLVFIHGDRRAPRVAVSNIDGSQMRDLTTGSPAAIMPAWSPDGRRIAFTTRDSASHGQIAVVGADGSDYRLLTHFDPAEGLPQWVDWAPDGRHLVIQAGKYNSVKIEESTAHLWIVDVATGNATKLAPHATVSLDETPSWFPDGAHIALQSNRTGVMQVWVMNADGTAARQVTSSSP
jgi:Tol biopolymer transport system component